MNNNRWDKIREAANRSEESEKSERTEASRLSSPKKESRRTRVRKEKEATRDEFGQPIYKGTMTLPEMTPDAKRALTTLVQQGTQDTGEIVIPSVFKGQTVPPKTKVMPLIEPKSDHLLIKGIQITKNMQTGAWVFGEIETNHGTFAMGAEHNARMNQKMLQTLALYLKDIFEADLKEFLGMTDEPKEKEKE